MRKDIKQADTTSVTNDSGKYPVVQITYLEKVSDSVVVYPYGTSGSPPLGSRCLLVTLLGDESVKFAIPLSSEFRPKNLLENEFACGNFKVGSIIHFKANGDIDIECQNEMNVTASKINVTGDIIVTGDVISNGIPLDSHKHGGVQTGGSNTGIPIP